MWFGFQFNLSDSSHDDLYRLVLDPEGQGHQWKMAAPVSGVAATVIGKTMSAILELTPLDSCTTKYSNKGPVVLVTNFTLKLSPLSTKEEIPDPGSELAAAEVGWRYPRSVCDLHRYVCTPGCRSVTYK